MAWLTTNYIYRRGVSITSPVDVLAGHPVSILLPENIAAQGKIRDDFEDIEVTFGEDTPIFREVEEIDGRIQVSFNLAADIQADAVYEDYYIYHGNIDLINPVSRPSGSILEWPITIDYDDELISYTRPGEHWVDGKSSQPMARASVRVFADKLRLISDKGTAKGIMEVQIDGSPWLEVDLFSREESEEVVHTIENLDFSTHEFRVRVSGKSNTSAVNDEVNIKYVEYRKPLLVTDTGEQVTELFWSSSVGGA